jgi:hypothetical protein
VADVISVRVKLLVAAGKWQNSGRTPAAVVFSVMADVIPVYEPEVVLAARWSFGVNLMSPIDSPTSVSY